MILLTAHELGKKRLPSFCEPSIQLLLTPYDIKNVLKVLKILPLLTVNH